MFQNCCNRRGSCSPYNCNPCSYKSCKPCNLCNPCNPCNPYFNSCRYCCPRECCYNPCLRKLKLRDLVPTGPGLGSRPLSATARPTKMKPNSKAEVERPSRMSAKTKTEDCTCNLKDTMKEQTESAASKACCDCTDDCGCKFSARWLNANGAPAFAGEGSNITARSNGSGCTGISGGSHAVGGSHFGGGIGGIAGSGGIATFKSTDSGSHGSNPRSVQESCASYLNIVHDNMLETTKNVVNAGMKEFFKCTVEKIQNISTQMVRTECLLSKMYLDLLDRFAQQNEKNLRQFQCLTQMVTSRHSSMDTDINANSTTSAECECRLRSVGGVCNKSASDFLVNNNKRLPSSSCHPYNTNQTRADSRYCNIAPKKVTNKSSVPQQVNADARLNNEIHMSHIRKSANTLNMQNNTSAFNNYTSFATNNNSCNSAQKPCIVTNGYAQHEQPQQGKSFDNQNCEEQVLRIVKRLQHDTFNGESITDESADNGTSEDNTIANERKYYDTFRMDAASARYPNSLSKIQKREVPRAVYSDTQISLSNVHMSQA